MKKFRVQLSRYHYFSLTSPTLKKDSLFDSIVRILPFALIILFSLYIIVLLNLFWINPVNLETQIFNYSLVFIITIFTLYFVLVSLNGRKRLIDPPLFINVLFFALLTTFSAVLVLPAGTTNTFGTSGVRTLSGVFILISIALYYIINFLVRDYLLVKRFVYTFIIALSVSVILLAATSFGEVNNVSGYIIQLSILPILLIGAVIFSRIPKIIFIFILFLILLILGLSFVGSTTDIEKLYIVVISLSISGLYSLLLFNFINRGVIKRSVIAIKSEKTLTKKILKSSRILLLLSPIGIFLTGFIIQFLSKINFLNIFQNLSDISNVFNLLSSETVSSSPTIVKMLFGIGGRGLSPELSMVSNIIASSGIVGLIAYLSLAVAIIYIGFREIRRRLKTNNEYKLFFLIYFILVYLFVVSFFVYPSILLLLIWWIFFGMFTAMLRIRSKQVHILSDLGYSQYNRFILKGKYNIQKVIPILLIILSLALLFILSRINYI